MGKSANYFDFLQRYTMKLYWSRIECGFECGRLTLVVHSDWFLDRPRIDHDETDYWIWCLGFLSIGWEMAR